MHIELTSKLDARWTEVLRLSGERSLRRFVTVQRDEGDPMFAIEVGAESSTFEAAIEWRDWVVIGFGEFVHLVNASSRNVLTISLESYFSSLHPLEDALLIASADRVRSINTDGSMNWVSDHVGLDGVVISDVNDEHIVGEGEWDPPGGWRPFRLSLRTGLEMKAAGRSSEL